MSSSMFYTMAVLCACTGCLMLIVSLLSASWVEACVEFDQLIEAVEKLLGMSGKLTDAQKSALEMSKQNMKGKDWCMYHGPLELSVRAGRLVNVEKGIDTMKLSSSTVFEAFCIIFGLLLAGAAVIVIIIAVLGDKESYDGKTKVAQRTLYGCRMLFVAGIITVIGMAVYTGESAKTIHNPLMFMLSAGQSLGSLGSAFPGHVAAKFGLAMNAGTKDIMSSMFDGMDPVYGYAFIIGWLAPFAFMIGAVFTAFAKQTLLQQPYSEREQPL